VVAFRTTRAGWRSVADAAATGRADAREARDAGAGAQRSADALAETANIEIVENGVLGCDRGE
jgi:hypothetical protein